jgi:hypothetical protein
MYKMAYCKNCGKEVNENQAVCLECGVSTRELGAVHAIDDGGFLWGVLGFFVPIVGLILWLIWKDERPNTAKAVGIGALVNVGVQIVFVIVYIIIIAILIGTSGL